MVRKPHGLIVHPFIEVTLIRAANDTSSLPHWGQLWR